MRMGRARQTTSGRAGLSRRRVYAPASIVFSLGVLLTLTAFLATRNLERKQRESQFSELASRPVGALQMTIDLHLEEIHAIGRFYSASQFVERDEFRTFVEGILARRKAIQALEWAPSVRSAERASFEAAARAEGLPGFQILEADEQGGRRRARGRDTYYPVWYAEPAEGSRAVLGMDLGASLTYREALEKARRTERMAITHPFPLPPGADGPSVVAVLLPIYHGGRRVSRPGRGERRELQGFVVGVLRIKELVAEGLSEVHAPGLEVLVHDDRGKGPGDLIYGDLSAPVTARGAAFADREESGTALQEIASLEVADGRWWILCRPTAEYLASTRGWRSLSVLIVGLVFAAMVTSYVATLLGRAAWAGELVAERTAELSGANEQLRVGMAERERAKEALEESERQLGIRNRIAHIFLTIPDEEMYGAVLEVILDVMESKYGVFGYIDENGALVVPSMTQHIWEKCEVPGKTFVFPRETWGDSTWARAIREKRALYSNEPSLAVPRGHIPIRRHISLPVVHQEETIGLLLVADKDRDYDEQDLRLLESISEAIAPVLNARLLREREEEARQRTEKALAARNRELESFVYTASHDLRNPLVGIEGFAKLLAEQYSDRLDEEGKEYLWRVRMSAAAMSALLTDLLELSRLAGEEEPREAVAVGEAVAGALEDLAQVIEESRAEITVAGDLPVVRASRTRLRQVFGNLISNAIKFSREGEAPRVEVGWEKTEEGNRFLVKDKGVGIPQEFQEKVFEIFTRLKEKDVPGTGVGLAIVKRIVEAHGGMVGVESVPGEGSSFWFTLPDKA